MTDIVIEFWTKYLKADMIERQEIISNCPSMMDLTNPNLNELDEKTRKRITATLLMSWFDDLIETIEQTRENQGGTKQ